MSTKRTLSVIACAAALSVAAAAQAAAPPAETRVSAERKLALPLIERPSESFQRSLEMGELVAAYREALAAAREQGVAPRSHLLEARRATAAELRAGTRRLRERAQRAKRAERTSTAPAEVEVSASSVAGVPRATLESIADCESGGDPTAVNPAGYYGKYQFDEGTWASVGGTGNPAEASEAEQDLRAALLYQQAGSSPWPVCGA